VADDTSAALAGPARGHGGAPPAAGPRPAPTVTAPGTTASTAVGSTATAAAPAVPGPRRPGPGLPPPAGPTRPQRELVHSIEWLLADFLTGEVAELAALDPALGEFARVARDAVLAGGKRLRPTFAYWGWRGMAGARPPVGPLLPALAALELLHAFALVHDDVMDASATRRGRPTAHERFAAAHRARRHRGDPGRFGDAAGVLVGDLCLVWADRLMATAAVPPTVLLAARRSYDRMRVEAVAGQYLDVLGEAAPGHWSLDRALRVARHKTASYTVAHPLDFGAELAGAHPRPDATAVRVAYRRYGRAVGEAFQLRDDLLGVYGDPRLTGKPTGDDLRSGKPTALLMLARQLASRAQRAELDRAEAGPAALARRAAVVEETGAVSRLEQLIDDRVGAAVTALDAAPLDPPVRAALTGLARAATNRRA